MFNDMYKNKYQGPSPDMVQATRPVDMTQAVTAPTPEQAYGLEPRSKIGSFFGNVLKGALATGIPTLISALGGTRQDAIKSWSQNYNNVLDDAMRTESAMRDKKAKIHTDPSLMGVYNRAKKRYEDSKAAGGDADWNRIMGEEIQRQSTLEGLGTGVLRGMAETDTDIASAIQKYKDFLADTRYLTPATSTASTEVYYDKDGNPLPYERRQEAVSKTTQRAAAKGSTAPQAPAVSGKPAETWRDQAWDWMKNKASEAWNKSQ